MGGGGIRRRVRIGSVAMPYQPRIFRIELVQKPKGERVGSTAERAINISIPFR